jgi:toxin ParE1/3/4
VSLRLFAPLARVELREAVRWIAADNPDAAEALSAAAFRAAAMLTAYPHLGRVGPDLPFSRYRVWSLRGFSYLLVYDAESKPPLILRFAHQSRDLPDVLGSLL